MWPESFSVQFEDQNNDILWKLNDAGNHVDFLTLLH